MEMFLFDKKLCFLMTNIKKSKRDFCIADLVGIKCIDLGYKLVHPVTLFDVDLLRQAGLDIPVFFNHVNPERQYTVLENVFMSDSEHYEDIKILISKPGVHSAEYDKIPIETVFHIVKTIGRDLRQLLQKQYYNVNLEENINFITRATVSRFDSPLVMINLNQSQGTPGISVDFPSFHDFGIPARDFYKIMCVLAENLQALPNPSEGFDHSMLELKITYRSKSLGTLDVSNDSGSIGNRVAGNARILYESINKS